MNSKKSWIIFLIYALWLAGVVYTFSHASGLVEDNLKEGLLWFGGFAILAVGGVFTAIKLNKKK